MRLISNWQVEPKLEGDSFNFAFGEFDMESENGTEIVPTGSETVNVKQNKEVENGVQE